MKALCVALSCAVSLSAAAPADLPPAPRGYTVECQMVHVPARLVVALVPELRDETKAAKGCAKLQAMITRGEATLANYLSARGIEGEKIVAESLEETKSPEPFEDAQLPPPSPQPARFLERLKVWPHVGFVPEGFYNRNAGPALSLVIRRTTDPTLLECLIEFQHSEFQHTRQFDAGRLANGEHLSYSLTDFTVLRNRAALLVASGRPKLLDVHRLPGANAPLELVIVTVTAGHFPE